MSTDTIDCYILPSAPLPLLLPTDCIADVVAEPQIVPLKSGSADWMKGHTTWSNQRLSVISYDGLLGEDQKIPEGKQANLVVLNPIPEAIRKAYSGIVCNGDIQEVSLDSDIQLVDLPDGVDKRYVEGTIQASDQTFIVPKLAALAVAFSYF